MKLNLTLVLLLQFLTISLLGQAKYFGNYTFTEADTLRGMLRSERTCFDVTFYELDIKVDVDKQYLSGYVDVEYEVLQDFKTLQLDLFQNMKINSITNQQNNQSLTFDRQYNAVFVTFEELQQKGSQGKIRVAYEGAPTVAENAPWDGGFVWKRDKNEQPWIGVACEGTGASLWWPCKDHLSDEPDSMSIKLTVPDDLVGVANGQLRNTQSVEEGYKQYDWFVSYPINSYNVTLNIADYANFKETYTALDGETLEMDYYVLSYNLERAKKHFAQTPKVLACFERYFGKYPFWRDGFGMVETPYLGMEHQGAIAYGNQYLRGYLGGMIPKHMDWDYIIVHETGHEYFGNSVSCNDIAEVWIHESFTTYMEALFVECAYNYEEAVDYLQSQRYHIQNQEPIVGPKQVNFEGWEGSDHYYKGAWMLHTLRHVINDDELWWDLLRSFYNRYAISNIDTEAFIIYVNQCTRKDFTPFFEQYLYHPKLPRLEYKLQQKGKKLKMSYRWNAAVKDFEMPILVGKEEAMQWIYPTSEWQTTKFQQLDRNTFKIATELFLIEQQEVYW